ncbi:MAG: AAA family ATPase [Fimbriimonadaceae bacterium]|nr:AAA family ATPase [Fimbriimonadaceae bacterium]
MSETKLTRLQLENFTAFRELDVSFSPGVNVFIGTNGTGKTHLLKVLYDACEVTRTREPLALKLVRDFMPAHDRIGRLVHRRQGSSMANMKVQRRESEISLTFSNHAEAAALVVAADFDRWIETKTDCAYIPVKEMLTHAPGFRSLYDSHAIAFEQIYADIIGRALYPVLRGPTDPPRRRLLRVLQRTIDGKVVTEDEHFYLHSKQGKLEFSLLAEGMRKLGLIWKLIQNGTLYSGAVLFWDEPEANLNPSVLGEVVEIVLELQRLGIQVFLATHHYVVLKEFDLRKKAADGVLYHALYRDHRAVLRVATTADYDAIEPNAIGETFVGLYDREVQRALHGGD